MADGVTITVDDRQALAKFDRLTPAIRDELRRVLPDLARQLARVVDSNLATGLKSRKTLTTNVEMTENTEEMYAEVSVTSPSAGGLLPRYLEEGTSAHRIVGDPVLAFQWDFMGAYGGSASSVTGMAFFRHVNHPGFHALHYMQHAFDVMQHQIVDKLEEAARRAAARLA